MSPNQAEIKEIIMCRYLKVGRICDYRSMGLNAGWQQAGERGSKSEHQSKRAADQRAKRRLSDLVSGAFLLSCYLRERGSGQKRMNKFRGSASKR